MIQDFSAFLLPWKRMRGGEVEEDLLNRNNNDFFFLRS